MVPGHCSQRHTGWQNGIPSSWSTCWRNWCLTRDHNWIWSLWRLFQGNDLQFLSPQGFCSPLPPQSGSHTSTAPSSLANFVMCHPSFPLCFPDHGLCEFLKLFLFFPSLFGVESSYFSYSDSSPLLSHVKMSSQLSFLEVCFFAIALCNLGHTR